MTSDTEAGDGTVRKIELTAAAVETHVDGLPAGFADALADTYDADTFRAALDAAAEDDDTTALEQIPGVGRVEAERLAEWRSNRNAHVPPRVSPNAQG